MSFDIPPQWTFEHPDVAAGFDVHVREQLPWYELCTDLVAHIGRHFIPDGGRVYDIGASTGNVGRALADALESRRAEFIPIDSAADMAPHYAGPGELQIADATEFPFQPFDLAVCFLSLMFVQPALRGSLLQRLRGKQRVGSAIIIVDKCVSAGGYVGTILSRLAIAGKVRSGVPADQIIAKELSLSGVQRPLEPGELGPAVEAFRFGDFAGWIL